MQIEKALIDDRLGVSKESFKFFILTIYNSAEFTHEIYHFLKK